MSTVCVAREPEAAFTQTIGKGGIAGRASDRGEMAKRTAGFADSPVAKALYRMLVRCWSGVVKVLAAQSPARKLLRVCENVSLGDKRFVAVVQVGQERFLIGGATNSIAMLTRLAEAEPSFSSAMKDCSVEPALLGSQNQGSKL